MLRAAVALLLAAAALAAVDLGGLVDVVYNMTSPVERFAPTYVFEVDGCKVLVYVADPALKNSPMTAYMYGTVPSTYDVVQLSAHKELRPLTSAEVEKLLDALFQVLGPSTEAWIAVQTNYALWHEVLYIRAKDATQLVEDARKAVGAGFYLGVVDAQEARERGEERVAHLHLVMWRRGDLVVLFAQQYTFARLVVATANLSATVKALERARKAAGELWDIVEVFLLHGPYLVPRDVAGALREVAQRLEKEIETMWKFVDEEGQMWEARVVIHITADEMGPLYVVLPYPNGTVLDKATAGRLVRHFVELSGFCKSPLVVEFWPRPGYELPSMEQSPPLWLYIFVAGAAVAAVAPSATRRRRG